YASMVSDRNAETILLRNYIAFGGGSDVGQSARGRLEARQRLGVRETEVLEGPYQAYTLQMNPYLPVSSQAAGLTLPVSINGGKALRLVFDTAAQGILIWGKAAESLDLERLGSLLVLGAGDGAPARGWIGLAESVRIGDLRLKNCRIQISDRAASGADGVIGA